MGAADKFACDCSDDAWEETTQWFKDVFPDRLDGYMPGKEVTDQEFLIGLLGDNGYMVSTLTDQWCGLVVEHQLDKRRHTQIQFDYGLLTYALCAAVLNLKEMGETFEEGWQRPLLRET